MIPIPERTIERLCAYRRILFRWSQEDKRHFHSHELAEEAGITSAQVRRDLMSLNTVGTPRKGYLTERLIEELGLVIEGKGGQKVVLVGAGKLGGALISYLEGMRPDLTIVAVFENDPFKIGQTFDYVPCLPVDGLGPVIREEGVLIAIVAVPGGVAQEIATRLVEAGVRALVNFTPVKLKVPPGVFVQDVDIAISVEKSAYFARVLAGSVDPCELSRRQYRILLVADDHQVSEHWRDLLVQAGYDFQAVGGGGCAVDKARACTPDLIVAAVPTTEPEGFHFTGRLRAEADLRFTPILMLLSSAVLSRLDHDPHRGEMSLPVDAFLDSSASPDMLLLAVRRLLGLPRSQINVEGGLAIPRLSSRSFAA